MKYRRGRQEPTRQRKPSSSAAYEAGVLRRLCANSGRQCLTPSFEIFNECEGNGDFLAVNGWQSNRSIVSSDISGKVGAGARQDGVQERILAAFHTLAPFSWSLM